MYRKRRAKIVATLGPATSSETAINALFEAGVDVFRFNFSHGKPGDHARRYRILRELERDAFRPIGVMADMQGPKLRVGVFESGSVELEPGRRFMLDRSDRPAPSLGFPCRIRRSSPLSGLVMKCCSTTGGSS